MNDKQLRNIRRVLNVFENDSGSPDTDYCAIYVYNDGNNDRKQITLGRGFTDDGGNLKKVVQAYMSKGGNSAAYFQTKLDDFGEGILHRDQQFRDTLKKACSEQAMRDAQDAMFNWAYIDPALNWARERGFVKPLSQAVIIDSYLHSGSMLGFLMRRFPEKKPVDGGDEQVWIGEYLRARLDWLKNHSRPALRTTIYRPEFFMNQMDRCNWDFECPMSPKDTNIC